MRSRGLLLALLLSSLVGGMVALGGYLFFFGAYKPYKTISEAQTLYKSQGVSDTGRVIVPAGLNFMAAAKKVRPAVVHVKTFYSTGGLRDLFNWGGEEGNPHNFSPQEEQGGGFGPFNLPKEGTGSGVILTPDGFIATNNHVVAGAGKIEVVLENKKTFTAQLVGTDPNTDLALLKINAENLPFVSYGESDDVQIGEWVLAVGNPFDLTSTVTAGIVSAKGRNINLLRNKSNMQIESFIQTDAAVNPGNSGGALVNLNGQLVGINTAIASNTGSYTGYSFAVPASIVKKVMDDLLRFGEVQRALLGVVIQEISQDIAEKKGLDDLQGALVVSVNPESGAADAKIKAGDIITTINGRKVAGPSEMIELVARNNPGTKITVGYIRDGKEYTAKVTLKNPASGSGITRRQEIKPVLVMVLGAELQALTTSEKVELGLKSGVRVASMKEGGKLSLQGIEEGFIITSMDKKQVNTPVEVERIANMVKGGLLIEGIYPDGRKAYYAIDMSSGM